MKTPLARSDAASAPRAAFRPPAKETRPEARGGSLFTDCALSGARRPVSGAGQGTVDAHSICACRHPSLRCPTRLGIGFALGGEGMPAFTFPAHRHGEPTTIPKVMTSPPQPPLTPQPSSTVPTRRVESLPRACFFWSPGGPSRYAPFREAGTPSVKSDSLIRASFFRRLPPYEAINPLHTRLGGTPRHTTHRDATHARLAPTGAPVGRDHGRACPPYGLFCFSPLPAATQNAIPAASLSAGLRTITIRFGLSSSPYSTMRYDTARDDTTRHD